MECNEMVCQLCGVSFNIARVRGENEPRNAAWASRLQDRIKFWDFERHFQLSSCDRDSGCQTCHFVHRGLAKTQVRLVHNQNDGSYELQNVDDPMKGDDALASDNEAIVEADDDPMDSGSVDEEVTAFYTRISEHVRHESNLSVWASRPYNAFRRNIADSDRFDDQLFRCTKDEVDSVKAVLPALDLHAQFEHITGLDCTSISGGYAGSRISSQEMQGCRTWQCLARKEILPSFEIEADDEEFERHGDWYLTGLSDDMPYIEDGLFCRSSSHPEVAPVRHRQIHALPVNWMVDVQLPELSCLPFHPWCFEIYKRVSQKRHGHIDIEGLTGWYSLFEEPAQFGQFPRSTADVSKCRLEEQWSHQPGTEYLVANPLFLPDLPSILESSISSDILFDTRNGAFDLDPKDTAPNPSDPFERLPFELKTPIIDTLTSRDIANLRLASRAFRQLPINIWQPLIQREMPWLWEAWSDTLPYSVWATKTAKDIQMEPEEDKAREMQRRTARAYVSTVAQDMPELIEPLREAEWRWLRAHDAETREIKRLRRIPDRGPRMLPQKQTNWFKLYTDITRNWERLKGLRNRARIWADCEQILKSVSELRERGVWPFDPYHCPVCR